MQRSVARLGAQRQEAGEGGAGAAGCRVFADAKSRREHARADVPALENVAPVVRAEDKHLRRPVAAQRLLPLWDVDSRPREHFGFLDRDEQVGQATRHGLRLDHVVCDDMARLERKDFAQRFRWWRRILDLRKSGDGELRENRLASIRSNENGNRSDAFLENDARLVAVEGNLSYRRQHERAANRRVSREGQLVCRCEDAHAASVAALLWWKDEDRL